MEIRLRDEESGGRGTGLLDGIGDVGENGQAEVCLSSLLGVCATNDFGTCGRGQKLALAWEHIAQEKACCGGSLP